MYKAKGIENSEIQKKYGSVESSNKVPKQYRP